MATEQPRCKDCKNVIQINWIYCAFCRSNVQDISMEESIQAVEELISSTDSLTSGNISTIFKIFQKHCENESSNTHLLEEKIYRKFIRSISELEYTIKDMVTIAKKILAFERLKYTKEY